LKIAVEMNEALWYMLRMMGNHIEGATNAFCDNQSVVTNLSIPQSKLTKKHHAIEYHKVCESVAAEAIRVKHEKGTDNLSDVLTKFLAKDAFSSCVSCILMR
jgi:hypothetical protein